jgi:bacterioferritin-associated ferredoxin
MTIAPICPKCGAPAISVSHGVVEHFSRATPVPSDRWAACVSATCSLAYFCDRQQIASDDLTQRLWYKDKGKDVPVCYCSQLTRGEIRHAVDQGAGTIAEVQRMTGKNRMGFCSTENPLGFCCRDAFLREINEAKQKRDAP